MANILTRTYAALWHAVGWALGWGLKTWRLTRAAVAEGIHDGSRIRGAYDEQIAERLNELV